ncbi:hypothetical protein DLM45_14350 [Hyphomicrobium methylovorum]|uniref:hypothetical protein n=1 Tax=Hyphomicrobium methylovorum TaxID=84 RepID=UPI0015E7D5A0|nr:hypothetical protein [Hyphomicrobium methylovorum]MBA2127393.1 hypothetical protein [Hyphomicrobium methylovorum]
MQTITKNPSARKFSGILIAALMTAAMGSAVRADDKCAGFKWPVETEAAWMAAKDLQDVSVGGTLSDIPAKAIKVKLDQTTSVKFPVAPGIKKQALPPGSYSGWFTIEKVPAPGLYQVTISEHSWIDVVQGGELLQSTAFTGAKECETMGKSVRFELREGPVVVQVSGVVNDSIKVTIRPAADK